MGKSIDCRQRRVVRSRPIHDSCLNACPRRVETLNTRGILRKNVDQPPPEIAAARKRPVHAYRKLIMIDRASGVHDAVLLKCNVARRKNKKTLGAA